MRLLGGCYTGMWYGKVYRFAHWEDQNGKNMKKKIEKRFKKIKEYEEKFKKCSYCVHPRVKPWLRACGRGAGGCNAHRIVHKIEEKTFELDIMQNLHCGKLSNLAHIISTYGCLYQYHPHTKTDIHKIEMVQHRAARFAIGNYSKTSGTVTNILQ